jgi:zinc protease
MLIAVTAVLTSSAMTVNAQDTRKPAPLPAARQSSLVDVPKIQYSMFTLPNGLRVVLHEDHSSPIVATQLFYHAGSKNDAPGLTGLAHMFEHMLDEGTQNMADGEFRRVVQAAGGTYNAATGSDWTKYFTVAPGNQLETLLALEAERMANLSPALDSTRFDLERESVRNEYRETILSNAVRSGAEAIYEALFAEGAYSFPVIGRWEDLGHATVEDLRRFYDRYYVPNNAVLVIAGDFASADARKQVTKYFSPIPRGRDVIQPKSIGKLTGEKRLVVEHPSGQRQLWVVWRGAKAAAPDRAAALALTSIMTDRLRRLLVTERRLSSFMNPGLNTNFDLEESGLLHFAIVVTGSATEVERLFDSVATSIRTDGVTAEEVRRWAASYRLQSLTDMQSVLTKSDMLADGLMTQGNVLGNFQMVERAVTLTPADVQAAARKYMTGDRVVMSIVPTGKLDLISKPELPYTNATRKVP